MPRNRRRTAEETDSMLAGIDVFASALGAFIVLAVVALPFLFNTSAAVSSATPVKIPDPAIPLPVESKLLPDLDLILVIDSTGSMYGILNDLAQNAVTLASLLERWSENSRLGVIEVLDECDWSRRTSFPISEIDSSSVKSLANFVTNLGRANTGCNDDLPEAVHLAVRELFSVPWRSQESRKEVVIFSDNPPYGYSLGEVKSNLEDLGEKYGVRVSFVHPDTRGIQTASEVDLVRSLAGETNGAYLRSASSVIGSLLLVL